MRAQLQGNDAEDEEGMLHFIDIFSQTVQIKYSYLNNLMLWWWISFISQMIGVYVT